MSSCPSCPLSETPYEDQLTQKRDTLVRAVRAYPRFESVEIARPHPSPSQQGYRNRARMVVRSQAGSPGEILGFYEEGSRSVVPVDHCEAHHPSLEAVLEKLRPLLFRYGALRHFAHFVDVRSTAGHAAAANESVIVTLAGPLPERDNQTDQSKLEELEGNATALQHELQQEMAQTIAGLQVSVHLNLDREPSQSVLSGEQHVVAGADALEYELSGREFRVRPTTFFQVNLDQLETVHQHMAAALADSPERLVDLYCGVGAHGIALAASDTELFGTDIVELAIELARDNASRAFDGDGLAAEFLAASDTEANDWLTEKLDARAFHLITNPARAGMSPETIDFIGHSRPQTILYLSCEPRTLSRDVDRLIAQGYQLESIEPFDFMPQTDQVEALAVLKPQDTKPQEAKPDDEQPDSEQPDNEQPALVRERAYQPKSAEDRHFSLGVSGPSGLPDTLDQAGPDQASSTWIALVAGETIKHGFLPHSRDLDDQERIEITRLRKFEGNSVLRIEASTTSDVEVRQRLRAWGHPALGDEDYGDRNANHLAARHAFLDRVALHCVKVAAGEESWEAEVPGSFLGLMRLPRKVLEGRG
jgi:23S rRNA (uracil-5-)-methyltransferase RumA